MTIFTEGNLQIAIPDGVSARKFDEPATHGLTHCMKAVDFIVELNDRFIFIEFKDPADPQSIQEKKEEFIQRFQDGKIDEDLKYKYRDSFLYEWASGRLNKPIFYFVLIAIEALDDAQLLARTDALRKKLPQTGPASGQWQRPIVNGCAVFNLKAWNETFPNYPVKRIKTT